MHMQREVSLGLRAGELMPNQQRCRCSGSVTAKLGQSVDRMTKACASAARGSGQQKRFRLHWRVVQRQVVAWMVMSFTAVIDGAHGPNLTVW